MFHKTYSTGIVFLHSFRRINHHQIYILIIISLLFKIIPDNIVPDTINGWVHKAISNERLAAFGLVSMSNYYAERRVKC